MALGADTTRNLQTLLSTAVQRVQAISGATRRLAWTLRETGEPYVAAAAFSGDPPVNPDAADFRKHCNTTWGHSARTAQRI